MPFDYTSLQLDNAGYLLAMSKLQGHHAPHLVGMPPHTEILATDLPTILQTDGDRSLSYTRDSSLIHAPGHSPLKKMHYITSCPLLEW